MFRVGAGTIVSVWEINKSDLPSIPLYTVQELTRLANGNTLINNWVGSVPRRVGEGRQLIEVTPDKKVVGAAGLTTLGPASSTQLLTSPGGRDRGNCTEIDKDVVSPYILHPFETISAGAPSLLT